MKKNLCLFLTLLLLLAACGQKEAPESPAPAPASPDSVSEQPPESPASPASPDSASEEIPPEDAVGVEIPVVPIPMEADEDLKAAVEEVLAQYREGTVEVSDRFPAPPEGFAFPETLDWENLPVTMDPMMGYIRVTAPSTEGSGEINFFCSKFSPSGSDKTETSVSFILFE